MSLSFLINSHFLRKLIDLVDDSKFVHDFYYYSKFILNNFLN